jgi:hypothetical protein
VCRCAVNLLTLPLNLVDFFVKHSEPSPEPIAVARTLTVELGVVAVIPTFYKNKIFVQIGMHIKMHIEY